MSFDPDAYLAKQSGGFDPDAYLAKKAAPAPTAPPSMAESIYGGALRGATLGWAPKMEAGYTALAKRLLPKSVGGTDAPLAAQYAEDLAASKARFAAEKAENPKAYTVAELGGAIVPGVVGTVTTGGTAALPMAIGEGAVSGVGYSNADSAGGYARDALLGAGAGGLGYGAGAGLGKALSGVAGYASGKVGQAQARAAGKAAEEVEANIASARGSLGGEVQKGQRIVENLRRLGTELTPEEEAAAGQLEQRLAASTREALPGQAGTIATKDAELAALKQGASEAFGARKADLLSTDEMRRQLVARLLRYGPVAAGSFVGHHIGGPIGGTVGALAGAGTRPMMQSLRRMAQNPAVQNAVWGAVERRAPQAGDVLRRLLLGAAEGPVTEAVVAK